MATVHARPCTDRHSNSKMSCLAMHVPNMQPLKSTECRCQALPRSASIRYSVQAGICARLDIISFGGVGGGRTGSCYRTGPGVADFCRHECTSHRQGHSLISLLGAVYTVTGISLEQASVLWAAEEDYAVSQHICRKDEQELQTCPDI